MRTVSLKYTSPETLKHFITKHTLNTQKHLLLQVFSGICDVNYIQNLLKIIKDEIPDIKIIGTTTSGEIIEGKAETEMTVLAFSIFEDTKIETYITEVLPSSEETARYLIERFPKEREPKVAIIFADGLNVNGEEFMEGFHKLRHDMIIAGGLAGDNAKFEETIVFTEKGILRKGVVTALLFNPNLRVATKASFGWESVGKTMTVTHAEKNVVYEIDGQSAVEIYSKYLGEDIASCLPQVGVEFPLIIKKQGMEIPRAVLAKNEDGSLVFAGNISTGEKVTFGYGNLQAILSSSEKIFNHTQIRQSESIFVYSCMARLQLLGKNVNDELLPLQQICNVNGFFTYGEFYVESIYHEHELLNETMTVLALSEKQESDEENMAGEKYHQVNGSEPSLTLKALSHLISQTSKELEELNTVLRERVMEEVIKNNRKDQAMLQQTKLAQMGEMMSMIAHQWRQPLSAISTLSQTINLKASLGNLDEETALRLSDTITDTAMHLSQTIDDFREFFKPRKEKRETSYSEIIEAVLNIIETSMVTKNIEVIRDIRCQEPFNSYPNEIKQVVLNLLKNAQDALLESEVEKPYIMIRSYREKDRHILEVSDNAGGIPETLMNKIFEPYFSTKKKKDGTGLGLYMSKTIIEEHCDGILKVRNSSEGAVFRIELPASEKDTVS